MIKQTTYGLLILTACTLAGCGSIGQASLGHNHHGTVSSKRSNGKSTHVVRASTNKTAGSGKLVVLGFWAHHKAAPVTSLSASNHTLTAISPLWYSVTATGALTSKVDPALLAEAHKLHLAITPLVNDATGQQTFLTSKATRSAAVQNIDHMIAAGHYQGVNIDFEPPHVSLKSELTAFAVQLRDTLPKSDTITMDIVPHSGGAYDYAKLAPELNQFVLMSYDEHSDGTPAGPVAAMNWVQSVSSRLTKLVPPSKIDLGVALYGYSWAKGSTHAVTIPYDMLTAAQKSHATWNPRYQEMTATINGDTLWWENRKGISEKIAYAKKSHLAGIALWQVGYANSAIYQLLSKDLGTPS